MWVTLTISPFASSKFETLQMNYFWPLNNGVYLVTFYFLRLFISIQAAPQPLSSNSFRLPLAFPFPRRMRRLIGRKYEMLQDVADANENIILYRIHYGRGLGKTFASEFWKRTIKIFAFFGYNL